MPAEQSRQDLGAGALHAASESSHSSTRPSSRLVGNAVDTDNPPGEAAPQEESWHQQSSLSGVHAPTDGIHPTPGSDHSLAAADGADAAVRAASHSRQARSFPQPQSMVSRRGSDELPPRTGASSSSNSRRRRSSAGQRAQSPASKEQGRPQSSSRRASADGQEDGGAHTPVSTLPSPRTGLGDLPKPQSTPEATLRGPNLSAGLEAAQEGSGRLGQDTFVPVRIIPDLELSATPSPGPDSLRQAQQPGGRPWQPPALGLGGPGPASDVSLLGQPEPAAGALQAELAAAQPTATSQDYLAAVASAHSDRMQEAGALPREVAPAHSDSVQEAGAASPPGSAAAPAEVQRDEGQAADVAAPVPGSPVRQGLRQAPPVEPERFQLLDIIGRGSFGDVYRG